MIPKVGVVIPVKNGLPYVEHSIRNVIGQTQKPDRLVVVDNGSTDGTLELLERLRAELCFELVSEGRPGAASARDAGARLLHGCDLIAFCDADDLWSDHKLEKQVTLFMAPDATDLVCVYCANVVVDSAGVEIGRSGLPTLRGYIQPLIAQGHPVLGSMSAVVIRREAFEQAGGFDGELLADEDLDLFIRLSALGRFDFVPEHLTKLRSHPAQTSRSAARLLKSKGKIINKYPEFYSVGSSFIDSVRVEHLRIDLRERGPALRIAMGLCYPLVFWAQTQRLTFGRARRLLFPGLLAYCFWISGRLLLNAANRLARHREGAV